jgi:hypothetical protein
MILEEIYYPLCKLSAFVLVGQVSALLLSKLCFIIMLEERAPLLTIFLGISTCVSAD